MSCWRTSPTAGRFDGVTAALPGIDLEEMADRAALMTRTDRKYLVPAGLAAELIHDLADDLHVLDIDRQRVFAYRSLYYDTPDLLSYRTAATRRRRRFKVRRREYVDAGTSFLEVKTRTGRGDTEKVREEMPPLSGGNLPRPGDGPLSGEDAVYVAARLEEAGVAPPEDRLFPTLETSYRRTTLLVCSEGARATIDESLVWKGTDLTPYSLDDLVVLETKSAAAPGAVDRWLWRSHRRPQRISKFATGMALLDPRLPANHWHRTIGRLHPHIRSLASAA